MKVLVTGARGMLGRAVAEQLMARGDRVRVFQRNPAGVSGAEEVLGDVAHRSDLDRAVAGMDAVIHLAAKVTVTGAWSEFVSANVDGVRHLLDAMRAAGVPRLVHVSSPSVAHDGTSLVGAPAGPADPEHARGHYSRSKAMGELLALDGDGPELTVVAIRPHLVWGPGDTQLVGRIVERARSGRLAFVGTGNALMDTTYVDNAASAMLAALDRIDQARGRAFVVSNGEPRPVGELFERLCTAAGVAPPRRRVPFRVAWSAGVVVDSLWSLLRLGGDPPITRFLAEQLATAHWFDQRRTRETLNWSPEVSLDSGIERMARWYAANERST
jgi:nucleoside-diphosphate-sugar epimerase